MLQKKFIEKTETLLIGALGLAAALAWNEAIKTFFQQIFSPENNVIALFMYALVVTAIAVIAILWLQKTFKRLK